MNALFSSILGSLVGIVIAETRGQGEQTETTEETASNLARPGDGGSSKIYITGGQENGT